MQNVSKPLFALTAADLMSGPVVSIPEAMSLRGAAHIFAQFSISGAPVISPDGRCVGVLSTTDFVSWAERGENAAKRRNRHAHDFHSPWQIMDVDNLPEDEVGRYMTADPVIVAPDTLIGDLARKMTDAHIHRVVVVDEQNRPVGIVSSTDVLAALARAANRRGGSVDDDVLDSDGKRYVYHAACMASAPSGACVGQVR